MASLTDIANQINNTLSQIATNTEDTATTLGLIKGDTADMKSQLSTLNATNSAGFNLLAQGLAAVIDQQKTTNHHLDHQRKQNDTMICWLAIIADLLCRIFQEQRAHGATLLELADCLRQVKETGELVHGSETVEVLRRRELKDQIEECCPPEEEKPRPCFQPCSVPDFRPRDPEVPDFRPPQRPQPEG